MNLDAILLGIAVLIIPLSLAYTLFVQVPRLVDSRFRAKLWELRDELFDQVIRGDISPDVPTLRLINLMESLANSTRIVSLPYVVAARRIQKTNTHSVLEAIFDSEQTSTGDRDILLGYLTRLNKLVAQQLRAATILNPLGLLTLSFMLASALVSGRQITAKQRIKEAQQSEMYIVVKAGSSGSQDDHSIGQSRLWSNSQPA